jgi:hypothetical protein
MLDSNGSNTTAVAAVVKIEQVLKSVMPVLAAPLRHFSHSSSLTESNASPPARQG